MLDASQHQIKYRIVTDTWQNLSADAKVIRTAVFIHEQNIAAKDEWDDLDCISQHFVMYVGGQAMATARLLANHSIGRVAVLKEFRGLNLGLQLMQAVIDFAKTQQRPYVQLSSQVHAIGFYQALGFIPEGEQYLDCGIAHIDMRLLF